MRGRGVPPARLQAVAEHYRHFGGVSPINEQNRALLAAIRAEHRPAGLLGQPQLAPAGRGHGRDQCAATGCGGPGVRHLAPTRVLGLPAVPGRHRPRPGGRRARRPGAGQAAALLQPPAVRRAAPRRCGPRCSGRPDARLVFTAHSIPPVDGRPPAGPGGHPVHARSSRRRPGSSPRRSAGPEPSSTWSGSRRSGPPDVPWLGPDVNDHLDALPPRAADGGRGAVGFVSDHVEVLWDLDNEARDAPPSWAGLRPGGHRGPDPRFADGPPAGRGAHRGGAAAAAEHDPRRGMHGQRRPVRPRLLRRPSPVGGVPVIARCGARGVLMHRTHRTRRS